MYNNDQFDLRNMFVITKCLLITELVITKFHCMFFFQARETSEVINVEGIVCTPNNTECFTITLRDDGLTGFCFCLLSFWNLRFRFDLFRIIILRMM